MRASLSTIRPVPGPAVSGPSPSPGRLCRSAAPHTGYWGQVEGSTCMWHVWSVVARVGFKQLFLPFYPFQVGTRYIVQCNHKMLILVCLFCSNPCSLRLVTLNFCFVIFFVWQFKDRQVFNKRLHSKPFHILVGVVGAWHNTIQTENVV